MTQTGQIDDTMVIRPNGDIVASRVAEFRDELKAIVDQGHVNLAIDLSDVGIIDSKGLAIFMLCHKSVSARDGKLVVLTDNENFKQLFRVMRMDQHFPVRESLESPS